MTSEIVAIGPDGRRHVFPPETRREVIDRVMRQTYGRPQREARAAAARATSEARGHTRRSLWERAVDVARDTWNTNAISETVRARLADPDAPDMLLERAAGPLVGTAMRAVARRAREAAPTGGAVLAAAERQRREDFAAINDRQRGNDSFLRYWREGDYLGALAHGSAALGGTLVATAADPTSWIGGGRTLLTRGASQAAIAAGLDVEAQRAAIAAGVQDVYDANRTALSGAAGGAFSVLGDLAGHGVSGIRRRTLTQPEALIREDLEVGDALAAPPMSTREIDPTPPRQDTPAEAPGSPAEAPRAPAGTDIAPAPREAPGGAPEGSPDVPARVTQAGPEGEGAGPQGWESVDWGARRSPERAQAAIRHLDGLRKWIKPEAVTQFVKALDEGIPGATSGVHINERWVDWDAMGGDPDAILGLTNAMSDIFRDVYANAGDARQGWDQTAQIARQMGFTLSDVIKTHADITGEGGLTARAGALRDAALASDKAFYDQLRTVREAVNRGDLTGVSGLAESLHRTIVLSAMDAGASSEIARALQYRQRLGRPRFPRNDLQAAVDELGSILNKGEGMTPDDLGRMMDELAKAYETGGSAKMRQTVRQMRELGFWDYVNYYATASLLSAPTTHIRNAVGTPIHALFQIGERYIAAGIGGVRRGVGLGSAERVTWREANAYLAGTVQAWTEGLVLGGKAFVRGAPVSEARSSVMPEEMVRQVPFAFSPQRLAHWRSKPFSPKTWADTVGVAVFEFQRTLGFRSSVATDELYKALGRRMQLNALAYREAAYRAALVDPKDADKVFKQTLEAIQNEPSAEAFQAAKAFFGETQSDPQAVFRDDPRAEEMALILRSIDVRQMAVDHAQLLTFQNSGPIVEKWDRALRAVPILKSLYVNFVRTPVAILRAGIVDRNPVVGSLVAAGELTTKAGRQKHKALFDALVAEEQALARGGAEADLVLARQAMGAAVLTSLWMFWASGNVVGKQTEQERRNSGVRDYSFRVPGTDTWIEYTGMSPAGEAIGLVADTASALRNLDVSEDGMAAAVGAVAGAIRNNIVNKSFLAGVSDFMELMTGGQFGASQTAASAGEQAGRAIASAVVPRAIPGGALLRRVAQDQDPVIRDARSFTEMIFAGLPGLSETLAARRDFLGRPLIRREGERGAFQAFNTSGPTNDPLERELARLAGEMGESFRIGMSPRKLNGEDLTPEEYSRLVEVQGQLYRIRGRNLEETLRELIRDPDYRADGPEGQAYRIKTQIERFREGANRAVRDPRSEFYMGEAARRTGLARLEKEVARRGPSALRRAQTYGVPAGDPEVARLRAALFPEE
jgi:hypothetical protein